MPVEIIETSADCVSAEDLLRQLLNLVETTNISDFYTNREEDDTAVLLKIELNGACYTLTRRHSPSSGVMLSPREQEVVRLVTKGLSNKEIAAVLDISYLNLLKQDKSARGGIKAKRLQAGWNENYLVKVLSG
jgi:DNA-directed RNA polymerase specialized sigma subunit